MCGYTCMWKQDMCVWSAYTYMHRCQVSSSFILCLVSLSYLDRELTFFSGRMAVSKQHRLPISVLSDMATELHETMPSLLSECWRFKLLSSRLHTNYALSPTQLSNPHSVGSIITSFLHLFLSFQAPVRLSVLHFLSWLHDILLYRCTTLCNIQ